MADVDYSTLPDDEIKKLFETLQASFKSMGYPSAVQQPVFYKRMEEITGELQRRNMKIAADDITANLGGKKTKTTPTLPMQNYASPNKTGEQPQTYTPNQIGSKIEQSIIGNVGTTGTPPPSQPPPPGNPPPSGGPGPGASRFNPYARPSMGAFQSGIMTALRGVLGGEDKFAIEPKLLKSGALRLSVAPVTEKGKGQALVTDIAPGYTTPLGASVDIFGKSRWHGVLGPEIIVGQPTEAGTKGEIPAQVHSPMQAFAEYVKGAFSSEMRQYDPTGTPTTRFQALLSKGNRTSEKTLGLPVAGGMQWMGPEETEWAQGQESSRISVSIAPEWKDRNVVLESIRNRILQSRAAVEQGGATVSQHLWANAYRYVPIIDQANRMRMALAGQLGEGDNIVGVGRNAADIVKRMKIQPEARGPQAEMLELDAETGMMKQARPLMIGEDIQGGAAQPNSMKARYRAGYRVLGAPPGATQPWVTYVQPGTVFGADIESGTNAVYTDFLKEQGIISPGAPKPIRPNLPNLTMGQLATAKWQFGQFRAIKGEEGAPTTYEQISEKLPAALEPHSSTILGLLTYTNAKGLEQTVPISHTVARTTFLRDKPSLSIAEAASESTGRGVSGVYEGGKAPTDIVPNYLAGDITERFLAGGGGKVNVGTRGETLLEIPASTAVAASIKGIVKATFAPVTTQVSEGPAGEYDQRINIALDQQSTVQRQVYGITGALKLPDARMMGHFLAATPEVREKLVSLFGEDNPQMAEGMRRYLKFIEPQTREFEFQGETFTGPALQTEMLGRIYAKWKDTPYQWESTTNEMFGQMRQRVEALPPREQLQRYEYMGRIPEPAGSPNMLYRGLSSWGERYAWRRSFLSTLTQQQLDVNKFDIRTQEGRRAYQQMYGMSPLQTINRLMSWEPTDLKGATSQQFPGGEPIYKRFIGGPSAYGTLVAPLITEYPAANVRMNYETIASLNAVFPETADFLGLGVNQEYLGGESPTGYTPRHIRAWREVGEVSSLLASEAKNVPPPMNYVEMDENMRKTILAYEGSDLMELDKRIGGKGPIYDPATKMWIERPGTVEAVSASGFQGDLDVKTALSRWASQYPTALKGMASGMLPKSGPNAVEGERALYSLFAHRSSLFGSQRGGVMRDIASRYLAQSEYMRVGAISGLGYDAIKVNRQTLDNMLKQIARYSPEMQEAGLTWRSRIDNPFDPGKQARWIDVAKQQLLQKGMFPAIMGHSPVYSRIGGTMAVPMYTDETLRKMGINYPISTMVKNGRILQGSPLTVGTFQAGPGFTAPGSDFDFDPGMIAGVARGGAQGLIFLESGGGFQELANYFAMSPKARVREYERIMSNVGGAGIVPGNEFNQLGKEAKDALSMLLTNRMGTEAGTPGTASRFLSSVPWSDVYHQAATVLQSGVKGSWSPYIAAQVIKSAEAGLGRGGPEATQAESELGHFYGEYLENETGRWMKRGGPNALETIFSTTIFGTTPGGEYRLQGKVLPTDRWTDFWYGGAPGKNIGEPMEQIIKNVMAERVSRSLAYDIGREKNPSYHLAAYLGSVADEDVPALQARMEEMAKEVGPEKAIFRALMGTGEGGTITSDAYYATHDPTMAIAPFALSLSTFGKTFGMAGKQPRQWTNPETGLTSLSAAQIQNEPIWGMGGMNTIGGMWRSRPYQIGSSIYSLQRNQPTHLGNQLQKIRGNLPPESFALMQNYRQELEAQGKPIPSSLAYYTSQFGASWWATSENQVSANLEAARVLDIVSGKKVMPREAQEDLDAYYATHATINTNTLVMPQEGSKIPLPRAVMRKLIHPWEQKNYRERMTMPGETTQPSVTPIQPKTYVPSSEATALYSKAEMLRGALVTARFSSSATPEQLEALDKQSKEAWNEYKTLMNKEKQEQGFVETQQSGPLWTEPTPPAAGAPSPARVPISEQWKHQHVVETNQVEDEQGNLMYANRRAPRPAGAPRGGGEDYWPARLNAQGQMIGMELNTRQGIPVSGLFGQGGGGVTGEPPSDLETALSPLFGGGKSVTLNLLHQFANTSLPNKGYARAQVQAGVGMLNAWVGKEANVDLYNTLRIGFGSILGLSPEQSKMRELNELVTGAYTVNTQAANQMYQQYQPQIQEGSKVYRGVMGAMNLLGRGGVTTDTGTANALVMSAGIAGTEEAKKFGSSLTGNLSTGEQNSIYNLAAPGLASAYILEKEANALGMKTKESFGVSQEQITKYFEKLPAINKELETFQDRLAGLNKGSAEYKQTLGEMTKYLIEQKRLPLAEMKLQDVQAEIAAKRVSGGFTVEQMETLARREETAAQKVRADRTRLQALEAGEPPEKIAGQIAAEEGGPTSEAFGKMSRRLLGGFGLMYLRSIGGIIMQPTQLGYQEALQEQMQVQQGWGSRFGGVIPFTNPEQMYQRAAATYGGMGWSGIRQLQANIMQQHPSAQGALGMAESGIGAAGLVATMGWMAGTPIAWPILGAVAAGAGLITAGINVAGAANQPEKNAIAIASQMASGANTTPGQIKWSSLLNWSNYGYALDKERQGPMVQALDSMRKYQAAGGTDLMGFLKGQNLAPQQINQYMSMYQQVQASQYPNIDIAGLVAAQGLQQQYNIPLTQGQYGTYALLAAGLSQGIPYEQSAMGLAWRPYTNLAQQQQQAGQLISNWLGQGGLTGAQIQQASLGAQRYQQLGIFAPNMGGNVTTTTPGAVGMQPILGAVPVQANGSVNLNQATLAINALTNTNAQATPPVIQPGQQTVQGIIGYAHTQAPSITQTVNLTDKWIQDMLGTQMNERQFQMYAGAYRQYTNRLLMGLPATQPGTEQFMGNMTDQQVAAILRQQQATAYRQNIQQQVFAGYQALGVTNPNMLPTENMTVGQMMQLTQQQQFGASFQQTMLQGGATGAQAQQYGLAFANMTPQQSVMYQGLANLNQQQWGSYLLNNPQIAAQLPSSVRGIGGQQVGTMSLGMVGITPGGQLSGMGWGTQNLATAQLVSQYMNANQTQQFMGATATGPITIGGISQAQAVQLASQEMAQQIWGRNYQTRTDISQGAAAALVSGGTFGLAQYQQTLSANYQAQTAGNQLAQLNLQAEYQPKFWAIEDRQRALQNQQAQWGFQMQSQQMQLGRQQFYENIGMNIQQSQMQRGWTQQDWAYQNQVRNLQWGWRQEDFGENLRFMTGRERRLAERQMGRETTMHDLEGEQIQKQKDRQREMWALEDQRFAVQKKQYEENYSLQQRNLEKQKDFYEKGFELQNEAIALQREYWKKQHELQVAAAGASLEYAKEQQRINQLMLEFSQFSQTASAEGNLFNAQTIKDLITALGDADPVLKKLLEDALALANASGHGPGHDYGGGSAIGGSVFANQIALVGEAGPELVKSHLPLSVLPNNELKSRIMSSDFQSSWSNSTINLKPKEPQVIRLTVPIYVGDEFLEEKVIEIVDGQVKL